MTTRLAGAALAGLAACGPGAPPALDVVRHDLASPAAEGSGEPFLSARGDAVYLSWLQASSNGGRDLLLSRLDGDDWSVPRVIAHGERFFVNSADFPSVTPGPDGTLWAHWLERGATGGYDYGIRIVRSTDGGLHWSAPWTPHEDGSPTEHGFVSTLPLDDGVGFLWLDGRPYGAATSGIARAPAMTLRYRRVAADGEPGPESIVDSRVCDCCQTDAVVAASGPVAVYRDRSRGEIRDIHVTRLVDGAWTRGVAVHDDGWRIEGCPVNGPAIAAYGDDVAVAWFTGAGDVPRVRVASSSDGGATFGAPVEVDDGQPVGRVDVLVSSTGSALVSWLEGMGGESDQLRLRRVDADGRASESLRLTESPGTRARGFPRMVQRADSSVIVAWTDVSGAQPRVRLQRIEVRSFLPWSRQPRTGLPPTPPHPARPARARRSRPRAGCRAPPRAWSGSRAGGPAASGAAPAAAGAR
jgi:hypothetical protein